MNDNNKDFSYLGIAVIGNGRWAQNHIKILKECGAFIGAYDIDTDYRDVINFTTSMDGNRGSVEFDKPKDVGLHGVVIATDPVMHYPITRYALKKGIAVYCEKPIATQGWQLDELMKLRKKAIYQAGFQLLYDPMINKMRDNNIKYLISRRLGGNYRNESVVQTLMIHDIAVAAYIFKSSKIVDPYTNWGMRSECNTNLQFFDTEGCVAILHARYGLPHFRQMDFIFRNGQIQTGAFDNHKRGDLLALSIGDWLTAIRAGTNSNRAYMRFACNVQQIAFEIDQRIGIKDSVREDRIEHEEKETIKAD